jgi:hypothetical protein
MTGQLIGYQGKNIASESSFQWSGLFFYPYDAREGGKISSTVIKEICGVSEHKTSVA